MRHWLSRTIVWLAVGVGWGEIHGGEVRYVLTDLGALGITSACDIKSLMRR